MDMADEENWNREWARWALWFVVGFLIALAMTVLASHSGLSGSRELSRRAACLQHLSSLGKVVAMHWDKHEDSPPQDIGALLEDAAPGLVVCPAGTGPVPRASQDANLTRIAIREASDYVLVPLSGTGSGDMLMAYELPANHGQEVANVLYADCHVSSLAPSEFVSQVQRTNELHAALRRSAP
jgi:prepilin-type processing-associated H-X9-DG protein